MITIYNGLAVQSFGYKRFLPIGNPIYLAENLSRWGVDEIILLDTQRSKKGLGPDLDLLRAISSSKINTPLAYGGGIKSVEDAIEVISAGSERVVLDNLLHDDLLVVRKISNYLGSQALIGSFPLRICKNDLLNWYDHVNGCEKELREPVLDILKEKVISEALIIDRDHEGIPNTFDSELIKKFPVNIPFIIFGGLSIEHNLKHTINNPRVVSAAIGNPLNYVEHSVQKIKSQLGEKIIRQASYSKSRV